MTTDYNLFDKMIRQVEAMIPTSLETVATKASLFTGQVVHYLSSIMEHSFYHNIMSVQERIPSRSQYALKLANLAQPLEMLASLFEHVWHSSMLSRIREILWTSIRHAQNLISSLDPTVNKYRDTVPILICTTSVLTLILLISLLSATRTGRMIFVLLLEGILCTTNTFSYLAETYNNLHILDQFHDLGLNDTIVIESILKTLLFSLTFGVFAWMYAPTKRSEDKEPAKEPAIVTEVPDEIFVVHARDWYAKAAADGNWRGILGVSALASEAEINHEFHNRAHRFHPNFNEGDKSNLNLYNFCLVARQNMLDSRAKRSFLE